MSVRTLLKSPADAWTFLNCVQLAADQIFTPQINSTNGTPIVCPSGLNVGKSTVSQVGTSFNVSNSSGSLTLQNFSILANATTTVNIVYADYQPGMNLFVTLQCTDGSVGNLNTYLFSVVGNTFNLVLNNPVGLAFGPADLTINYLIV